MFRARLSPAYVAVAFLLLFNIWALGRWSAPGMASQVQHWGESKGDTSSSSEGSKNSIIVATTIYKTRTAPTVTRLRIATETKTTTQIIQQEQPNQEAAAGTQQKPVSISPHGIAGLPADYIRDPHLQGEDQQWCESRYGLTYLETLAKNARPFCEPERSKSEFDCLHSEILDESRKDSFCLARNVIWHDGRFNIDCVLRDWNSEPDLQNTPGIYSFQSYWYETGPQVIMGNHINFGEYAKSHFEKLEPQCSGPDAKIDDTYKILVKREGGTNYWHSLMEVFAFYFSIDALQMAINKKTGKPYMSAEDLAKIQVLILDDYPNKNYFELWNYFSDKPVQHIKDFSKDNPTICLSNLILPLPGASNTLWQGDWDPRNCDQSIIVDTLRYRVLNHLKIPTERDLHEKLNLTFIDRKGSRKLVNATDLTDELKRSYPNVNVNVVDMAKLTLKEQLTTVAYTDVLVGVHGAGHTHGFFLPPQSSIVEILPDKLEHRGFRNLAALRGLRYFSDHGTLAPMEGIDTGGRDWHAEDVVYDKKAFLKLVDAAIQSVAHRGYLDSDVS